MKDELLTAAQAQLPVEVTLTIPVLPEAEKFCDVGFMLKDWTVTTTGFETPLPQELVTTTS